MTALDWVLLLVVGVSALLGLLRGVIGLVASLLAWALAGVAALAFGGDVGRSLVTDGQLGWGEVLGGYALSFLVVWMVVALIGWVVKRVADSAGLSGVDRMFGLGLGVVRGVFFACVLLLGLGLSDVPREAAWRGSALVAVLLPGAQWMRGCLPPWAAQRIDLEGRGASLQASVKELQQQMPHGLPAAIPEGLMAGVLASGEPASGSAASGKFAPEGLPEAIPDLIQGVSQQVSSRRAPSRSEPSTAPVRDDKLVH
ncbi:CvpA family protein [Lysobacter fragariae]